MNFQQLLLIVWARRKVAFLALLLTVAASTAISLLLPKQYIGTTSLVFDIRTDPIAGGILPGMGLPGYITTQTDIMQSSRTANRAVKILRLAQNPEAVDGWREATEGRIPFEQYYGQLLLPRLAVKPSRGSNVVSLSYTSSDPEFAAAVANAFAQAYVDVNVDLRVEPARQFASWFDERRRALRADLEKAQAKLSAYQQEKGIVATDDHLDTETARLAALTAQLATAQGQTADTASREKNTGSEISPDVMDNPIIQSIKSEIAKAEAKLSEMGSSIGSNHPLYRQLEAQIAGLKQQMGAEIHRISGSAAAASRVTVQKEEELKAAIQAQKKYVLELRAERDAIAILARDVESAQRAYDTVSQRISLSSLESQMQQNNVTILSPATVPDAPAKPRLLLNFLASIVAGTLLGIGAAIGQEKLDRRIRAPEDMAGIESIPLLGMLQPKLRRYTLSDYWAMGKTYLRRRSLAGPAAGLNGEI